MLVDKSDVFIPVDKVRPVYACWTSQMFLSRLTRLGQYMPVEQVRCFYPGWQGQASICLLNKSDVFIPGEKVRLVYACWTSQMFLSLLTRWDQSVYACWTSQMFLSRLTRLVSLCLLNKSDVFLPGEKVRLVYAYWTCGFFNFVDKVRPVYACWITQMFLAPYRTRLYACWTSQMFLSLLTRLDQCMHVEQVRLFHPCWEK